MSAHCDHDRFWPLCYSRVYNSTSHKQESALYSKPCYIITPAFKSCASWINEWGHLFIFCGPNPLICRLGHILAQSCWPHASTYSPRFAEKPEGTFTMGAYTDIWVSLFKTFGSINFHISKCGRCLLGSGLMFRTLTGSTLIDNFAQERFTGPIYHLL